MGQICGQLSQFAGDWLHAAVVSELGDAPADASTPLRLTPGQSLNGTLAAGDVDWLRIEVNPGTQFTVQVEDAGGITDSVLTLFNAQGQELAFDDDGGVGLLSAVTYTGSAGVYYAAISTYQTHYGFTSVDTGDYRIVLNASGSGTGDKPVFSNDEIAEQLINGYWEYSGRSARSFDAEAGASGEITVNYSALAAPGQWFAEQALDAWSAVTGLTFRAVSSAAQIRFDDEDSGAYASSTVSAGVTQSVFINVSRGWISGDHYQHDGYSLQTFIHEIGHALGLGHAGNYNAGDEAIDYARHARFANDSWQASVMSYFSQTENPEVAGSRAYVLTPMVADLVAIQALYGASGSLRDGNTTYGAGSTAGDFYDILSDEWQNMAFTIIDDGGRDLLNLSNSNKSQVISLKEESYSSVGGQQGNMGIARGTQIEDVRSGSGADEITGNAARNRIEAGGGNDLVSGERGADSLFGQRGDDTLSGGWSDDTLKGGNGRDELMGDEGNDRLEGEAGADLLDGGAKADFLHGGADNDTLLGGDGRDTLRGGAGDDSLDGGTGHDRLFGAAGRDRLDGRDGNDRLSGNDGNDAIQGGQGDDKLWGGKGADTLGGGSGNDRLAGQEGNDRLWADHGNDTLLGNSGDDTLTGGAGADRFVFSANGGADAITDWTDGEDVLDISALGFSDIGEVRSAAIDTPDGVLIDLGSGTSVLLAGVEKSALGSDDFLL